ncbi:MAG: AAA family ATPase [endosymbiont of Galathealinum brachiosum]|uniref:AAA family ATPase n=1 Tax=endosymbiont of Galathealinum brachiosum TaxID=2200906 RepID=A0A370DGH7_9GAMM|nr:MAG: AAA family ATPase [endosymbiont of Galathealinum brachiosum]
MSLDDNPENKQNELEPLNNASSADSQLIQQLKQQINNVFIGQEDVVDQVMIALIAAGHVLVEGVPGLGKTLLVRLLAKSINGQFSRIQFTPDLMPSDITGHIMFDNEANKFRVRRGPVFTNLLLADEINRAPAKTQSALLEVMQEHQVTLEGKAMPVPEPYMVMATQNPIEQEGTYPLPEAQLDRFIIKIKIDYSDSDEEHRMVKAVTTNQVGDQFSINDVAQQFNPEDIVRLQRQASDVSVDEAVSNYAVEITRKTRDWPGISNGAGPRGGIAIVRCARAYALMQGRDFVTPDDVKHVALPVLRHRVILSPEMELEGMDSDRVITALLEKVSAPRK